MRVIGLADLCPRSPWCGLGVECSGEGREAPSGKRFCGWRLAVGSGPQGERRVERGGSGFSNDLAVTQERDPTCNELLQ
jgi:hypothetical protein